MVNGPRLDYRGYWVWTSVPWECECHAYNMVWRYGAKPWYAGMPMWPMCKFRNGHFYQLWVLCVFLWFFNDASGLGPVTEQCQTQWCHVTLHASSWARWVRFQLEMPLAVLWLMQGATWTTLHEMLGLKTATSFIVIAKKGARFLVSKRWRMWMKSLSSKILLARLLNSLQPSVTALTTQEGKTSMEAGHGQIIPNPFFANLRESIRLPWEKHR